MKRLTHEEFSKLVDELYGSKYKVIGSYINTTTKVEIECPEHGIWKSKPQHLLKGHKCPKCAGVHRYTTEEFVEKYTKMYGNKYDLSLVEYKTALIKVKVICPIHGIFETTPNALLNGVGCGKCDGKNKTTEDIIQEFKAVHGDKFNYEKVKYINTKTKVIVTCKEHGDFFCNVSDHLRGHECPKCYCTWKRTTEDIIKEFKAVHGDKFDYSLVDYVNANTNVKIICNSCKNIFEQTPSRHLRSDDCCKNCSDKPMYNRDLIIENFNTIHNFKYDYSKFIYNGYDEKSVVICPIHGEFQITYGSHKNGAGCNKCSKTYKPTTEEFIAEVSKIHDFKYDYSKFEYINAKTKSTIICPYHGPWLQTPNDHRSGYGCPVCKSSKGEKKIFNFLKNHNIKFEPQYRIKECRNIYPLPFDFAVLNDDGSIKFLIEMQGKQHFEAWSFTSMSKEDEQKEFQEILKRDKIKKDFCENNSIDILYITYKEINKIPEILSEKLNLQSLN